jgi:hypothetical protein
MKLLKIAAFFAIFDAVAYSPTRHTCGGYPKRQISQCNESMKTSLIMWINYRFENLNLTYASTIFKELVQGSELY